MNNFIGSIIEIKDNYATVMTDVCDFVMLKRQTGMFIGQQIKFQKSDLYVAKKKHMKSLSLVASLLILIFSYALFNQFFVSNTAYAYIDVDINPSLEFVIDKNAKVLDIKTLNKDAKTLLKGLKLINLPIKQAVTEVVKESKKQGFIKPSQKNSVLISASIGQDKNNKLNTFDEKDLNNILTDIGSTTFDLGTEKIKPNVLKVTPEYRKLAVKNEISMGRYVLYNKIKQENVNISIEKAKTDRVSDMLDKAQINNDNEDNGDTQINETRGNNNYERNSSNEERKNVNKYKNNETNNNIDNSNTETSKKQNNIMNQRNIEGQSNKVDDNSNTSINKNNNNDISTTLDSGDKKDNANLDGVSNTSDENQESGG